MNTEERIIQWKKHESIRGYFAFELYKAMATNKKIILLTGDLGFGMFDAHKEDMPDQYINCGASEQAMMGIAVGMALEGKIPCVYSITNFLLYRPFETIRNYVNHESIPVKLIGSGLRKDYEHDGFSHWSEDYAMVLDLFPNIIRYEPHSKEQVPDMVKIMLENKKPSFMGLQR